MCRDMSSEASRLHKSPRHFDVLFHFGIHKVTGEGLPHPQPDNLSRPRILRMAHTEIRVMGGT